MTAVHGWRLLLRPSQVPPAVAYRLRRALDWSSPRAANPYGTHVPVLVGLAGLMPIRRVLELGSGRYSTLTFLDRRAFPELVHLDSYETDRGWLDELAPLSSSDGRLNLQLVPPPMAETVAKLDLSRYDLILVDDSTDERCRAATIHTVVERVSTATVLVIHDFEVVSYREAARPTPRRFAFTALNPNTGVCWMDAPLARSQLEVLNSLIKQHAKHVEPHDRAGWVALRERVTGWPAAR